MVVSVYAYTETTLRRSQMAQIVSARTKTYVRVFGRLRSVGLWKATAETRARRRHGNVRGAEGLAVEGVAEGHGLETP